MGTTVKSVVASRQRSREIENQPNYYDACEVKSYAKYDDNVDVSGRYSKNAEKLTKAVVSFSEERQHVVA